MCSCNQIFGTNSDGIPYFLANMVNVRETSVDFGLGFRSNFPPIGYMTVNIATAIPDGTTDTLPIRFVLNNQVRELTFFGGDAVTVGDLAGGTGEIMLFHNAFNGTLRLMSPLPTAAAATQNGGN